MDKRWIKKFKDFTFMNERIITMTLRPKYERGYIVTTGFYALGGGKKRKHLCSVKHYKKYVTIVITNTYKYSVILVGYLNTRVGSNPIQKLIGPYGEPTFHTSGAKLREFVTHNNLRITNEFFRKKNIHKYSASDSRSIIDLSLIHI